MHRLLITRFFVRMLCLLVCFLWMDSAIAQDAAPVYDLKNIFTAGETIYVDMSTQTDGVMTTKKNEESSQVPIHSRLHTIVSYKTLDVAEWSTLEIGFHQMIIAGEMLGKATQDLVETLGLGDRKVQIKVDSKGTVQEIPESGDKSPHDPTKAVTRQMPYLKFPPQPIPVGTVWTDSRRVPITGAAKTMIANTTYTLNKVIDENGQKIAVILSEMRIHEMDIPVESSSSSQKNVNVVVKFTYKEYSLSGKGEIRFSLDRGRILSVQDSQDSLISMLGDTDVNKASFPQDVIQKFTQVLHAEFSDQLPLPANPAIPATENVSGATLESPQK